MKHIKKMLQSRADVEANLFEYLSQLPSMQLASLFPDVWKLFNREWCDDRGLVFSQQYLNIRPLQITGIYSMISCLIPHYFLLCCFVMQTSVVLLIVQSRISRK